MIDEPKCSERNCKHFLGVLGQEPSQVPNCKAFPKGIPNEIAWGDDPHLNPRPDDRGFQFEKA